MTTISCQAWLSATTENGILTVTGNCRSLDQQPTALRYELRLTRKGASGQSTNSQQGSVKLSPGQTAVLSQVQINADEHTSYVGQLRILDATGQVVAQDSIRHDGLPY